MIIHYSNHVNFAQFFVVPFFSSSFEIYIKQFLGLVVYGFVEDLKRYLLIIKRSLIRRIIEQKITKILRAQVFMRPVILIDGDI